MKKNEIRRMIEEAGSDRSVQDRLIDLMCEIIETLEMKDPQEMKRIEKKMYDNGMNKGMDCKFDKEMAEYIVNEIYQKNDISQNERLFTYQKAEQLAKQHKIPLDEFSIEDWYITLVMAESDFKKLLGTNFDNYVTYAKLWLMDKDAPHGASCKLYDYLCYVAQIIDEDEMNKYDNGYGYNRYGGYDDRMNSNGVRMRNYDNGMGMGMYNNGYPYISRNGYDNRNDMMYDDRYNSNSNSMQSYGNRYMRGGNRRY